MPAPAIEFSGVTKSYRRHLLGPRRQVLSGVSFEVPKGEVCGFLGANGAGKTTSLSVLMGFIFADQGRVRAFGYAPGDIRAKERIGFLPENFAFYRHLDAETLLHFHLRLSGREVANPCALITELLRKAKLDDYAGLRIGKYSRGMMQRLGIAQALIGDPDLLVLDEPTSGLDPAGRKDVRDLISSLRAEGKTIFLSSHILSDIEHVCDRVIIIDHGRLVRTGSMQELLAERDCVRITVDHLPESIERSLVEHGASVKRDGTETSIFVDKDHKRLVQEQLWASGCDVLSLTATRNSLEDVFLSLVEGDTQ